MKRLRFVILGVALLAGTLAAYLALNIDMDAPSARVVEVRSREVLVASMDISQGWRLKRENVRWQRWPDDAVNLEYVQKQSMPDAIEKLEGSVARAAFVAGEPIREVKLARAESGFLSAILPSGMRAIAVRIQASNTAGGFILPNDRVDVIQTITQQTSSDAKAHNISQIILTNVKVLAIDQTIEEKDGEPVVVGKTATLELDPKQAEFITAAETNGLLSLALRSSEDVSEASIASPISAWTRKTAR